MMRFRRKTRKDIEQIRFDMARLKEYVRFLDDHRPAHDWCPYCRDHYRIHGDHLASPEHRIAEAEDEIDDRDREVEEWDF